MERPQIRFHVDPGLVLIILMTYLSTLKFDQIIIVGLLPLEVHGGSSGQFIQIRKLRLQYFEAFGWPGTKGAAFLPHHYGVFAQTRGQVCPD